MLLLHITVFCLGRVLIYSNAGNSGVRLCVTHLQKFAPTVNGAAAVCVLPDASGLAFILLKGSVLLVPLRCILVSFFLLINMNGNVGNLCWSYLYN